uniref:Potassium channel subfamily K member 18 n=1 Tax=Parastrongyloides trichosuri TaxID=131310 RepID=A0A0N4ZNU1_PARTI
MVKFAEDTINNEKEKEPDLNQFYNNNEDSKVETNFSNVLSKRRRSSVKFSCNVHNIDDGNINVAFNTDDEDDFYYSGPNKESMPKQIFNPTHLLTPNDNSTVRKKSMQFINNALFSPIVEFTVGVQNDNNNIYKKRKSIAVDPELTKRQMLLRGRPSVFQTMARVQRKLGIKHYVLVLILAIYAVLGGLIFYLLESESEIISLENNRDKINDLINGLASEVLDIGNNITQSKEQQRELAIFLIRETYKEMLIVENKYAGSAFHKFERIDVRLTWYFSSAIFYSMTLFTSIGYGTIACQTVAGKVVTIIYASLGIPLMLVVLGDVGDVLLSWFIFSYNWSYHKVRRTWNIFMIKINYDKYLIKDDDDQDFPLIGSVLIIIIYMLFISMVICLADYNENNEGLSFGDAFYFTFISMTTIGLGDVYPTNKNIEFNPFIPLLFLFGLALLSVVNSTMYSKMQNKFLFFVEKIEYYLENLTVDWKGLLTCGMGREHIEGWETLRCLRRNIELLTISIPLFDDDVEEKISKLLEEETKKEKPKVKRTRTISEEIRPTLGILRAGMLPVIAERTNRERSATDNSIDKFFRERILTNLNNEASSLENVNNFKKIAKKRVNSLNESTKITHIGDWKSQFILPGMITKTSFNNKKISDSNNTSRRSSINMYSSNISINIETINENIQKEEEKDDSLPIIEEETR